MNLLRIAPVSLSLVSMVMPWPGNAVADFDDAPAALRLTLEARPGEDAVHTWVAPHGGALRLVGDLRKTSAETAATFEIRGGGTPVWSRLYDVADIIRHGMDVTVYDLAPQAPVEFRVIAKDRPVSMAATLHVVPERFVSRWAPHLPSGYPAWTDEDRTARRGSGQKMMQAIREASAARLGRIVIPAGDYLFPADWSRFSTLRDLADMEIMAEGATFWFEPPLVHGLLFENCRNVIVRGLVIDFTVPCWFQAKVTAVDRESKTIRATIMEGYEPRDATGQPETEGQRAIVFYDKDGRFINHRHSPGSWRLSEDGREVICHDIGVSGIPARLQPGDHVVGTLRTGAALRSRGCAGMRFEDVAVWSSPGQAVNETGGAGAHVYRRVRATRRPATNRLHAFGADIFHLSAADRGPSLERCDLAYGADDVVNIHGRFGRVVKRVDDRHWHLEGVYETGDTIAFWDQRSITLLGTATIVEATPTPAGPTVEINDHHAARGEYLVEIDTPLSLPILSLVVMAGKRSAAGFVVRDCWLHDTFQRVLINGAPDGLFENNTLQNLGHGLAVQFETWGPWMEGPFARDLCIRNNRFLDAPPDAAAITVSLHPPHGNSYRRRFPSTPVTNLEITGNCFTRATAPPLEIHNVKGLTISDNSIDYPADAPLPSRLGQTAEKPWCFLQDCTDVVMEGNEVAAPAGPAADRGG